jgi:hypothetical protein
MSRSAKSGGRLRRWSRTALMIIASPVPPIISATMKRPLARPERIGDLKTG